MDGKTLVQLMLKAHLEMLRTHRGSGVFHWIINREHEYPFVERTGLDDPIPGEPDYDIMKQQYRGVNVSFPEHVAPGMIAAITYTPNEGTTQVMYIHENGDLIKGGVQPAPPPPRFNALESPFPTVQYERYQ